MTHIELSLSPLSAPATEAETEVTDPLTRWAAVVDTAEEACVALDGNGIIVAASAPCALLLRLGQRHTLPGKHFRDVLYLIDFTAAGNELVEADREQIPPLLAITSGQLARGLMRVRHQDERRTIDAIATPVRLRGRVIGSLSFFAVI